MTDPLFNDTRSLEDVFFLRHDAALIEELRRREAQANQKKLLAEVLGIPAESVLNRLVEHGIHAESVAAFALVPIMEVAWADGAVQKGEAEVVLRTMEKRGIPKGSLAYQIAEEWLQYRPDPNLMAVWKDYTRHLIATLDETTCADLRKSTLENAQMVAEAVGGFLGFGSVSEAEKKIISELTEAFEKK
jgi:hypothetical protein